MNKLIIILISSLILSCATSNKETLIDGTWANCSSNAGVVGGYVYDELKFSKETYEKTLNSALDNQCINIEQQPESSVITINRSYVLYHPHLSSSGLIVYKIDLFAGSISSNQGVTPMIDYFDIIYIDNDRLFFGKNTKEKDGRIEKNRPIEIDFEYFYTKI